MRYLAFVSYAHRDAREAHRLHRAIETYRLPRRLARERGLPPRPGRLFLDRSELPSSADLSAAIGEALGEAANLLLVCSPAAAASRWVNEEVRRFRALRGRGRIFCVIVAGDPARRGEAGGCFPPTLLAPEPGDAAPMEPLAADLRPGQDRRSDARLKLVAGMLGVPFDALRQRDQARRLRRLSVAAAALAALAAALLALAVAALVSRAEARRQAETATRTADFLRELLASAEPDAGRGRAVTVRELVDRGVARIAAAPELRGEPRVRADLMTMLADVYVRLGEYRAAAALVERAAAVDRSDPLVAMRQDSLRAELAHDEGRFGAARALLTRALAGAGPAPSHARSLVLLDLAAAERGLGHDAAADAALAAARRESLAQRPPDLDAADRALLELARHHLRQGRYDQAERELAALLGSRRRLGGGADPLAAAAFNERATIRYKQGDDAGARRWFTQALLMQRRLLGPDHPALALIEGNLARTMVEQRAAAPALRLLAHARRAIVAEQGDGVAVLAAQDDSIGLARRQLGDLAGAEAAFRRGVAVARATGAAKLPDLLVDEAALLCATGRAGGAAPLLDEADRLYAGAPAVAAGLRARAGVVRGACLVGAGDRAGGAALVRRHAPAVIARWGRSSLFGGEAAAALARLPPG